MPETLFDVRGKRVFVAGETGMAGRAIVDALTARGALCLSAPRRVLDLAHQAATFDWLARHRPDAVIVAAAKVGGIHANNSQPAAFIGENLAIAQNLIDGAHRAGVQDLLFLGSSCIYPRDCAQPMTESMLLTGALEPTNEAYAIAKIAGLKMCEFYARQYGRRYMAIMPTNLYGPHDRFDDLGGHVIPSMFVKFAQSIAGGQGCVTLWGSGRPLREFLYVADLAQAVLTMMAHAPAGAVWNAGSGEEVDIKSLAHKIAAVTGFDGDIIFNPDMPDGTPRKLLESSKIRAAGWAPSITLDEGLMHAWEWFQAQQAAKAAA